MAAHESRLANPSQVFASLGDPIRLAMVSRLCVAGPVPTVRLKQVAGISRQAVTKHLRLLEASGIVRSERVGRDRLWRIEKRPLAQVRLYLDQISAQWDATLERLRKFVEDDSK